MAEDSATTQAAKKEGDTIQAGMDSVVQSDADQNATRTVAAEILRKCFNGVYKKSSDAYQWAKSTFGSTQNASTANVRPQTSRWHNDVPTTSPATYGATRNEEHPIPPVASHWEGETAENSSQSTTDDFNELREELEQQAIKNTEEENELKLQLHMELEAKEEKARKELLEIKNKARLDMEAREKQLYENIKKMWNEK